MNKIVVKDGKVTIDGQEAEDYIGTYPEHQQQAISNKIMSILLKAKDVIEEEETND